MYCIIQIFQIVGRWLQEFSKIVIDQMLAVLPWLPASKVIANWSSFGVNKSPRQRSSLPKLALGPQWQFTLYWNPQQPVPSKQWLEQKGHLVILTIKYLAFLFGWTYEYDLEPMNTPSHAEMTCEWGNEVKKPFEERFFFTAKEENEYGLPVINIPYYYPPGTANYTVTCIMKNSISAQGQKTAKNKLKYDCCNNL
jgi:hypothetical protein